MLDNSLDFVHLWLGLGLTGVVEVPINTAYKGRLLTHMLTDSAAKILVIEEKYLPRLEEILIEVPTLESVVVRRTDPGAWLARASSLLSLRRIAHMCS